MEIHFEHLCGDDVRVTVIHKTQTTTFMVDTHISGFPESLIGKLIRIWNGENHITDTLQIIAQTIEFQWLSDNKFQIVTEDPYLFDYAQDNGVIISFSIERHELCTAFWKALRELETKVYLGECEDYLADRIPFRGLNTLSNLIKQDQDKEQS